MSNEIMRLHHLNYYSHLGIVTYASLAPAGVSMELEGYIFFSSPSQCFWRYVLSCYENLCK
jgi:hypothetical protein